MAKEQQKKKGAFNVFLDLVERGGNKLPHPVTIFLIFSIAVIIISHFAAIAGVSVDFTMINRKTLVTEDVTVKAVSLLSADNIRRIFADMVKNFTGFAPLGTVLVAMLGVGIAEGTGLVQAALRKLVLSTPKRWITVAVVFAGIMSNVASDAGYIVLVPLGALVFLSFGRHPLAGLAAAFAGVSGGFSANLLVGTVDPLLGGISQQAAQMMSPGYTVAATANWFFMIASTFLITAIGTFVTERIVEPRLGEFKGKASSDGQISQLSKEESKGLIFALLSLVGLIVVLGILTIPGNALLRNPETGSLLKGSAFMKGIVPIITLFFAVPGLAYGLAAKTIRSDKDVAKFMSESMSTMGGYLVLAFVAAQFIAYFSWSNLGTIIAVKGADVLKATGFTGLPLLVAFILVSGFINLFIGSASAKWAIMAPVFVPMFMAIGYSPELTQVAYRIGDSTTNIISPLMSYFAIIVAFAQKYDKDTGIGTLISTMLPYSIMFLIGWGILFTIWFVLGLPLGPGAFMRL